jgi:ABC-type Fe3+/spermidine/putrescine transport system ATPase subunit
MDEPFGALDKRLREELQAEVRRLHQTLGVTVVFVTHDQAEALAMSDRIAIMNGGRLEQVGTGSELYESPKSLFVADFMGESNVFRGRLLARGAARWVAGDGWEYPVGPSAQVDGVTPGDAVAMICRPERMRIARVDGTLSQPTCLVGRLTKTTYLGGISRHEISLREGRSVTVVTLGPDRSGAAPGDEVRVEWCADDTIVVPDTGPGGDTP